MVKPENELTWKDLEIGAVVLDPGNARSYKTGNWRSQRTTYDFNRCIKCGVCYIFCPEGCIKQNKDGYFEADEYYCKGCGICACECPTSTIAMQPEEES